MQTLRLVALDIAGKRTHWVRHKPKLREQLQAESPDLALLYEVLRPKDVGICQADELVFLPASRVYFSAYARESRPFPTERGTALCTRFALREHRSDSLALYAVCSGKVGVLPLYGVRLAEGTTPDGESAAQIAGFIRALHGEQQALVTRIPEHVTILPPIVVLWCGGGPISASCLRAFAGDGAGILRCATSEFVDCGFAMFVGDNLATAPATIRGVRAKVLSDHEGIRNGISVEIEL